MPIDDLTALGDALRAARKEKNLTQEQLADESHVSTKQIADIEKARRNPSYLTSIYISEKFHIIPGIIRMSIDHRKQNTSHLQLRIDLLT